MRRFIVILLVITLIPAFAMPAFAFDGFSFRKYIPTVGMSNIENWYSKIVSKISSCFTKETSREIVHLEAPEITTARFYHNSMLIAKPYLLVAWNSVCGADGYEIKIEKADGAVIIESVPHGNSFILNIECPKVYIESENKWASATVMVRAFAAGAEAEWSNQVEIGCDELH